MNATKTATALIALAIAGSSAALAQAPQSPVPIDYSVAGYQAGKPLPVVKAVISVRPTGKDDTILLPECDRPRRGASASARRFPRRDSPPSRKPITIGGHLQIRAGGVVLRGSGPATTTIVADGISRRTSSKPAVEADPTPSTFPSPSPTSRPAVGARTPSKPRHNGRHLCRRACPSTPPQHCSVDQVPWHDWPSRHLRQRASGLGPRLPRPPVGPHNYRHRSVCQPDRGRRSDHHRPREAVRRRHHGRNSVQPCAGKDRHRRTYSRQRLRRKVSQG